jgi:hypothetical protein
MSIIMAYANIKIRRWQNGQEKPRKLKETERMDY